jgi:hypothetical protein
MSSGSTAPTTAPPISPILPAPKTAATSPARDPMPAPTIITSARFAINCTLYDSRCPGLRFAEQL